jgi:hypothetical protein
MKPLAQSMMLPLEFPVMQSFQSELPQSSNIITLYTGFETQSMPGSCQQRGKKGWYELTYCATVACHTAQYRFPCGDHHYYLAYALH